MSHLEVHAASGQVLGVFTDSAEGLRNATALVSCLRFGHGNRGSAYWEVVRVMVVSTDSNRTIYPSVVVHYVDVSSSEEEEEE